jgi:DNA replication protein DnaC
MTETTKAVADVVPGLYAKLDLARQQYRIERQAAWGFGPDVCPGCGDAGVDPETGRFCWCETGRAQARIDGLERVWPDRVTPRAVHFRLDTSPAPAQAATVRRWLSRDPIKTGENLILIGPAGTGKTGLAIGALHVAHMSPRRLAGGDERPTRVAFANVPDWLQAMRPTDDDEKRRTQERATDAAMCADLLLLDDLGADRVTEWVVERVYSLVNARYEANRPTIVTSNAKLAELATRYGERVIDRLTEHAEVVRLAGKNVRKEAHRNG